MFTPDDFEFGKVTNRVTKPLACPNGASPFAQAAIPLGRPALEQRILKTGYTNIIRKYLHLMIRSLAR